MGPLANSTTTSTSLPIQTLTSMLSAGDTGGVLLDEFFANFTESECAGASIAANFTKGMNHLSYYKLRTNVKGFTQLITAFEQSNYKSFSKSI